MNSLIHRTIPRFCAVALALSACPSPLWAQSDDIVLEEILVTAQRRLENLQEVPAAVTAISADKLERRQIANILELESTIPNLTVSRSLGSSSGARLYLRGIGEDDPRATVEPAISMYVDDVYIGRQIGALYELVDLERVEALRGPQGTLYGRNSNGGAIRLVSAKPNFTKSEYRLKLTAGDEGRADAIISGNIALSDVSALRFSVMNRTRDGLFRTTAVPGVVRAREVGEWDILAYRISWRWQPNDRFEALISFDRVEDDSDPLPPNRPEQANPYQLTDLPNTREYEGLVEQQGLSVDLHWYLDSFELRSLTSIREQNDDFDSFVVLSYDQITDQEQLSQEFQISSRGDGPLNWVAGFFYFDEDISLDNTLLGNQLRTDVATKAWALFAQGSYDLQEDIRLTLGLRYTDEEKDFRGENVTVCTAVAPNPCGRIRMETRDFTNTDVKLAINYDLQENITLYGSYTTGFKSGSWSADAIFDTAVFLPVDEEDVSTYEIGLRSDLWDNRLRLNLTLFDNDYENLQISGTTANGFTRFNVPEASTSGAELELNARLNEAWSIDLHVGYLETEYKRHDFISAAGIVNPSTTPPPTDTLGRAELIELAGTYGLKNAPKWTSGLGLNFGTQIDGLDLSVDLDLAYQSESNTVVSSRPEVLRDDALTTDIRVSFAPVGGVWEFSVWGKNLDNQLYIATGTSVVVPGLGRLNDVYTSEPRTIGADLTIRF